MSHDHLSIGFTIIVVVKIMFPFKLDQIEKKMVMIPFQKRLPEGLRHFNGVREWGIPWLPLPWERENREGGEFTRP